MVRIQPPKSQADHTWLTAVWREEWGGETMVTRGTCHHVSDLAALIAWDGPERVGLATYLIQGETCELMSLNALNPGSGVGSALLAAAEEAARQAGCTRIWLITSNDNVDALKFYQRKGYRLEVVHLRAIDEARRLKPSIPLVGFHDIPIHDEWELSKTLREDGHGQSR